MENIFHSRDAFVTGTHIWWRPGLYGQRLDERQLGFFPSQHYVPKEILQWWIRGRRVEEELLRHWKEGEQRKVMPLCPKASQKDWPEKYQVSSVDGHHTQHPGIVRDCFVKQCRYGCRFSYEQCYHHICDTAVSDKKSVNCEAAK